MKTFYFGLSIFLLSLGNCFAQINWPTERSVFQRGTNDFAEISFASQYIKFGNFITASYRILKLDLQDGHVVQTIVPLTALTFNNNMSSVKTMFWQQTLYKGWYQLDLIIYNNGAINAPPEQEAIFSRKFGVGDVFIIAGQSNSQGYRGSENGTNPSDDKNIISYRKNGGATDEQIPDAVNVCNLSVVNEEFNIVPTKKGLNHQSFIAFDKIKKNNNQIFPNGVDSWCYAELGKDIVSNTQCPVAFFNAGASGSDIQN